MKKFSRMLLASDFDATLTNSQGDIPENSKAAIRYFVENGGYFSVSTGRTAEGFHRFEPGLMNAPLLFANGAAAVDCTTGKTVFSETVDSAAVGLLNAIIEEYPSLSVECYGVNGKSYCLNTDGRSRNHFKNLQIEYSEVKAFDEVAFPLVKIMLSAGERSAEIQRFLGNTDMGNVKFIPCSGDYIELISTFAGKGRGLLRLASLLGVPDCGVFAVGDGANDVDMLEAAALSFAPSSGDIMALNAADITVCGCDSGAVADVIAILDRRLH